MDIFLFHYLFQGSICFLFIEFMASATIFQLQGSATQDSPIEKKKANGFS
jgi:hypothetical protein